jgi:hypothetical protein
MTTGRINQVTLLSANDIEQKSSSNNATATTPQNELANSHKPSYKPCTPPACDTLNKVVNYPARGRRTPKKLKRASLNRAS